MLAVARFTWCPETESNRHVLLRTGDFKSRASASFSIRAGTKPLKRIYQLIPYPSALPLPNYRCDRLDGFCGLPNCIARCNAHEWSHLRTNGTFPVIIARHRSSCTAAAAHRLTFSILGDAK